MPPSRGDDVCRFLETFFSPMPLVTKGLPVHAWQVTISRQCNGTQDS